MFLSSLQHEERKQNYQIQMKLKGSFCVSDSEGMGKDWVYGDLAKLINE